MAKQLKSKFNEGDFVTATGYPDHKMVIEELNFDGSYTCYWQDKTGKKLTADYKESTLVKYELPAKKNGILDDLGLVKKS